jgi:hypothetical protein
MASIEPEEARGAGRFYHLACAGIFFFAPLLVFV